MSNKLGGLIILLLVFGCKSVRDTSNRNFVSITDHGARGDDNIDDLVGIKSALAEALSTGKNLFLPQGTYFLSSYFPVRNTEGNGLMDYKGITIFGEGDLTKIITTGDICYDVLQLHSVKNIKFKDFTITAECNLKRSKHGANGVSLTGGSKNISFERIVCRDLPFIEKKNFFDGGSAFSIQPGNSGITVENISFLECKANNCVYGFGIDLVGQYYWSGKLGRVEFVGGEIKDCMRGVSIGVSNFVGKGKASLKHSSISIKGNKFMNCEISLLGSRLNDITIVDNSFSSDVNGFNEKDPVVGHIFFREVTSATIEGNKYLCKSCLSKEDVLRGADTYKSTKKRLRTKMGLPE